MLNSHRREHVTDYFPLENRVAMISGGAGDIGLAIARELIVRGANIAIGDICSESEVMQRLENLLQFRDMISQFSQNVVYTSLDASMAANVTAWIARTEDVLGTPDIVIPCAAQVTFAETLGITDEQWDREIQVNLNGRSIWHERAQLGSCSGKNREALYSSAALQASLHSRTMSPIRFPKARFMHSRAAWRLN